MFLGRVKILRFLVMRRLFLLSLLTSCVYAGAAQPKPALDNERADWLTILGVVSSQLEANPNDVFLINCVAVVQAEIASLNAALADDDSDE